MTARGLTTRLDYISFNPSIKWYMMQCPIGDAKHTAEGVQYPSYPFYALHMPSTLTLGRLRSSAPLMPSSVGNRGQARHSLAFARHV